MIKQNLKKIATLISLLKLTSFCIVGAIGMMQKTWTYELVSVASKSSAPEKLNFDLDIQRVSRGVYAITGEFKLNIDIVEGDLNYIGAKSYRSAQGDGDYKLLPYQVPDAHFFKILNTFYKNVLMDSLKKCSDMPVFENTFEPPLEKKTYTFNACEFSQDGLPDHLQDGVYKISISGTGEVEWLVEVVFEVTPAY